MTTILPTLAEQQRVGLETTMTERIIDAIAAFLRAPPSDVPAAPRRALPQGVYVEQGRFLVARFNRRDGGKLRCLAAGRGALNDFTPETAARLARACKEAAAVWDKEHGRQ